MPTRPFSGSVRSAEEGWGGGGEVRDRLNITTFADIHSSNTHLGSKDLKLARVGVDIVIKVDSLDASFVGREVKIEIDAARADSHGRLRLVHTTFKG